MITCAIVGATGLVGSKFLEVLEEKKLKIDKYYLFASSNSKGKIVNFLGEDYTIYELTDDTPKGKFTYALFSAGGDISKKYARAFADNGTIVIDNSSAFRMETDVPLIVPEINFRAIDIKKHKVISNPNCSTIQAVMPLKILHDKYKLKRVVFSTYQAVSGAGQKGIIDLGITMLGRKEIKFPHKIFNNCIPQIDDFEPNLYTKEEMKMINETRKILDIKDLPITATCVRVPVLNSHSESINIELEHEFNLEDIAQLLSIQKGIVVLDEPDLLVYPLSAYATGKDEVFVGRIRRDYSVKNGLNIWVVADNIRKGAATNAVQILEKLIESNTP